MAEAAVIPEQFGLAEPDGQTWYRLVPSRFPPVQLWDRVASHEEFNAMAIIESVTNPRLGELSLVPEADRLYGPGTSPIMSAFCHPNPDGSRFSDGSYGVYYAADSVDAAVAEVSHHRRRWYLENRLGPRTDSFRCYIGVLAKPLLDIRPEPPPRLLHDPSSWQYAQAFGNSCRQQRSWGIRYQSVRHKNADCIALLRPPAAAPVIQGRHLKFHWDGKGEYAVDS